MAGIQKPYSRPLNDYLAEDWIPALKYGAQIDGVLNVNNSAIIAVELNGVPIADAKTVNFVGGTLVDAGGDVVNYTPPSGGSGTATAIQTLAADPGAPANGDIWLNTTSNELKQRINGVTQVIYPQSGGTGTATDFQLLATDPLTPADGDVWYNTTDNAFRFYQNGQVINLSTGLVREDQTGIVGTAIVLATTVTGSVFLFKNGLLLNDPADYTIAGQNITLSVAAIAPDTFTALIGSTDAVNGASITNNNTFLGDNIFQGDTTFEGDVTVDATSTITNVSGSAQVYNDGSIITNNSTETYGTDYEAVYNSGSTINLQSGSQTTYEDGSLVTDNSTTTFGADYEGTHSVGSVETFDDESTISNQADETFGAGYEGTYASGSTTNVQSGATWDFNAGATIDFTGATVTGLPSGGALASFGTSTRSASGTQTITHNNGSIPSIIKIIANYSEPTNAQRGSSYGVYKTTGAVYACAAFNAIASTGANNNSNSTTSNIVYFNYASNNGVFSATISNNTANSFDLVWSGTLGGGSIAFVWEIY